LEAGFLEVAHIQHGLVEFEQGGLVQGIDLHV
jgi:hypothetical protein